MGNQSTIKYEVEVPDVIASMARVHGAINSTGLDRPLQHLIQLRASQMNGCGYCVQMHTSDARDDGETNERLDQVIVWDQVDCFSDAEKAALAWTEALTALDSQTDFGQLRARLREHFSEKEIGALTAAVAMINLWNRVNISRH